MSAPRVIPEPVIRLQIAASDPVVSAWVSANAGSGKTHVLAQRVIRLLLDGVEPGRILCITFTKAAAANMANRVFDELRKWTALDDAALDRAMQAVGVRKINHEIDHKQRARARRLFALALETPGGLKVQTIHAFCTRLLHLFPFEANVAARFTVLDEATETQLLQQLTLGVLLEAAAAPDSLLGRALANAIATGADQTFRDMIREAIRNRDRVTKWIDAAGDVPRAIAQLSQALGIAPDDSEEKVTAAFFGASLIAASEWPAVAAALAEGLKTDVEHAERFRSLATLIEAERTGRYIEVFCTKELLPRKSVVTKTIKERHPGLFQRLVAEQERVCALLVRRRAIAARDRTGALVAVADAVIGRFRLEKNRRGLLDYEDLIDKSQALLSNVSAAWVHYKLDRGIDHVLIDEAQDTSPKQWSIVRALVAEFFAGAGARSGRRTIFAVGDEKQSIFSFQGAVPREFEDMRREFDRLTKAVEHELRSVRFGHSFRSGANVLNAVDKVFEPKALAASITSDTDGIAPHIALPEAAPGLVEIWDTEKPADRHDIEGWDAPFDTVSETSPVVRLAGKIAKSVAAWQRQGARPRDVLILVRRRGPLFEAVIRALKNESIPVAGADRLVLTEHIAVMDLMVLADALLLPDDELALATILKSPLFGLDEEALFTLAWNRAGTLLSSLRAAAAGDPLFAQAAARLDRLAEASRRLSPFAFYAQLLGAERGRQRILARLGVEATDALDEFLNLALDYERRETPSLQGFVSWLRASEAEVKRDMEIARDEVRVMTVHGAKGLEAPIVILADTTTPPQGWHPPRLLSLPVPDAAPGAPPSLVWAGPKAADIGAMSAARDAARIDAENEYRRLLYVAMTRAAERLIVCGVDGATKRPDGCWYDLVLEALRPDSVEEPAEGWEGSVLRYRKTAPAVLMLATPEKFAAAAVTSMPEWLTQDAPAEPSLAASLTPSHAYDDAPAFASGRSKARAAAIARGNAVHRLIQSLPDVAAEHRAEAARRFLARRNKELTEIERASIAAQVLALLADSRFAALFAPDSRAEVPIVGRLGQRPINGLVDRLVVTADAVLIADYKTNRPAPRHFDEVRQRYPNYVAQLALYRAVLTRLYPDRPVRAALVWTDTPEWMEISPDALDSALLGLTTP